MPTFQDYPARYKDSPLNKAFAVELNDLIKGRVSITGFMATHHQFMPEFRIGSARLVTNQLGVREMPGAY